MDCLNEITQLINEIEQNFPTVKIWLESPPETETGSWWLDIENAGQFLTIEWRPGRGFGLGIYPDEGFGSGPDEVYLLMEQARARIFELLRED